MDYVIDSFRMAERLLVGTEAWADLSAVLDALTIDRVVEMHNQISVSRNPPAGAQTAINALLDSSTDGLRDKRGWQRQVRLFPRAGRYPGDAPQPSRRRPVEEDPLRAWTMDFKRDKMGVEISFNHAEATAWQFTKLSIAGESDFVDDSAKIDVGVVVTAHSTLKNWGSMDGAVLTFDVCRAWLAQMRPVVPTPILLLGLTTESAKSTVFRGTRKGGRSVNLSNGAS